MNVPGIRAALRRMNHIHECDGEHAYQPSAIRCEVIQAVVRVGLRACDDLESHPETCAEVGTCEGFRKAAAQCEVIADILREAGVEVVG